ncbi:MAG: serine hydrolase [Robiginitalea sp.]
MRRSKSLYILPVLFFLILVAAGCEKKSEPDLQKEINAVEHGLLPAVIAEGQPTTSYSLQERMKHYDVPGVSIAVVKDGKLHWAKGYGLANTQTGQEVTTQTLFQAGSISKPLAALAVLKLWEEGRIDLDTDVNTYLRDWKVPDTRYTANEKVTLRRLLTHTAGMTVHGFPGYGMEEPFPSIIQVLNGEGNTWKIICGIIFSGLWD